METIAQIEYNQDPMRVSPEELEQITGVKEIDFKEFCRSVRKEQSLSQVEMAAKLDMSSTAYEKLESGKSNPSADTLIALLVIRARKRSINLKALFLN